MYFIPIFDFPFIQSKWEDCVYFTFSSWVLFVALFPAFWEAEGSSEAGDGTPVISSKLNAWVIAIKFEWFELLLLLGR